jgi:hypothetical protein
MINEFLQASSNQYPKELDNRLIHPLHQIDCRIISEIIEVFNKAGLSEVKALLDQWKYLKDTEIYETLAAWNEAHPTLTKETASPSSPPTEPERRESPTFQRPWIFFKNFRIELSEITCYECRDEYDFVIGEMRYYIIINPLSEATAIRNTTTNKVIEYENMEQRNRDFAALDTYMQNFKGINFINSRND